MPSNVRRYNVEWKTAYMSKWQVLPTGQNVSHEEAVWQVKNAKANNRKDASYRIVSHR